MTLQRELGLPQPISDSAHEAIMNIVYTGEMLAKEGQRILRPLKLTDSQFNVLIILEHQSDAEGLTQTELGNRLLVNRSNVTGLVDRMEQAGWVKRTPVAGDRRMNKIQITDAGKAVLEKAEEIYYARIREVMNPIPPKDLSTICTLMEKVRKHLRE